MARSLVTFWDSHRSGRESAPPERVVKGSRCDIVAPILDATLIPSKLRGLGLAVLFVSVAASARAQTYTVIDLGTLPGGNSSYANGINNRGEVVGYASFSSPTFSQHPFLFSGGAMIDLGTLGGFQSVALGINNSGQVAGISDSASGPDHAFLNSAGSMIDLGTLPGESSSGASSINNNGQVVGYSQTEFGFQFAILYTDGSMIDLGTLPGGGASYAYGINNTGRIVGQAYAVSDVGLVGHAFLYSDGRMIDLGTLGGFWSSAFGINDSGQVVGQADSATGNQYQHAFLYRGGNMLDLGTLPVPFVESTALGINNSGQIVGYSDNAAGLKHAFLYDGGNMTDLNNLVTLPAGVYLMQATGINDPGQIIANGNNGHAYLLTPEIGATGSSLLTVLNPFAPYASNRQAPPILNMLDVLSSPQATCLAADGESAVVLEYKSTSPQPTTFAFTATAAGLPSGTAVGSLGQFDPNYLVNPNPTSGGADSYQVNTPTYGPDAGGNYWFLALLWGPKAMPAPNNSLVHLAVIATQPGGPSEQASISLAPPPVLLVHGIWSSAAGSGFSAGSGGFYDWLSPKYPNSPIYAVDYGLESSKAFDDPSIQNILLSSMTDALAGAATAGMAARSVDVVAHSMGGLVTRHLLSLPSSFSPDFLPNPVHKLITIGTPHQGTNLATTLVNSQNQITVLAPALAFADAPELLVLCLAFSSCTLGDALGAFGRPVGAGVQSLDPTWLQGPLYALSASNQFAAIVGEAPSPLSLTEIELDLLINAFLPLQTVSSILSGQPNDTIVPTGSQAGGRTDSQTIPGIVHTALNSLDIGETMSPAVWAQAYWWLTGGTGPPPAASVSTNYSLRALTSAAAAPAPVLNLAGYTQVAASNFTILPVTGSVLTINSATNITAASSTKTITELLMSQIVTDPADTALFFATQSPFAISFTPIRLGSTTFGAVTVFSDNTYAVTTLNYTFQPSGTAYALDLVNAPVGSIALGTSQVVQAYAIFSSGRINVTQVATYAVGSGSTSVFGVSSGATITANGNGVDLLNVSYGGVTATAQIAVGPCTYALNPSNQIVPNTGGTAAIQVTTQSGCAWTASGGAAWLPFAQASGSGNDAIMLPAEANSSGGTQAALVTLAGLTAVITQPATACSYGLSQAQITAPAGGASGTITVTTSCPVIASSNQSWVTATPLGSSVVYSVVPNDGASPRSATLTIGSVGIPVTQAGNSTTATIASVTTADGGPVIAQNTFIVIKGTNLVPATTPAAGVIWSSAPSFASGQMPTQLNGVSVTVNGKPAYIYFFCSAATSPVCTTDQLNVLTPLDNSTGPVPIVVNSGAAASAPFSATLKAVAPAFLLFAGNYVAATHANGGLIGPASLYPGASTSAQPGEQVVIYAVGFGLPSAQLTAGSSAQSGSLPALPVCTIGTNAAAVAFAGLITPGLYQLNIVIPTGTPNGDQSISCTYGGSATPTGDLITVGQ